MRSSRYSTHGTCCDAQPLLPVLSQVEMMCGELHVGRADCIEACSPALLLEPLPRLGPHTTGSDQAWSSHQLAPLPAVTRAFGISLSNANTTAW